jgi:hypothetical protein
MNNGVRQMLSEKFFLYLEALIKGRDEPLPTYADGAPRVTSAAPHVPVMLPLRGAAGGASASR